MEAEIVASIVSGVLGVIGGLAVGYKDEIRDLARRSKRSVAGVWAGSSADIPVPGLLEYRFPLTYVMRCDLKQSGSRVSGAVLIESDRLQKIDVEGVFEDGEYLLGSYRNSDRAKQDYGRAVMRLSGDATTLDGFFIGRRMREDGFVIAHVHLTRDSR